MSSTIQGGIIQSRSLGAERRLLLLKLGKSGGQAWREKILEEGRVEVVSPGTAWTQTQNLTELKIPPSFNPVEAQVRRFKSATGAKGAVLRQWGAKEREKLGKGVIFFRPYLNSVYYDGETDYGIFGLYTQPAGRRPELQSVHVLLPVGDGVEETIMPFMAVCFKAPWNHSDYPDLSRQYRGLDLAILVHTLRTYFNHYEVSLESEVAAGWRLLGGKARTASAAPEKLGYEDLVADLALLDLEAALEVELGGRVSGEEFLGFKMLVREARQLLLDYQGWLEQVFGRVDRGQ